MQPRSSRRARAGLAAIAFAAILLTPGCIFPLKIGPNGAAGDKQADLTELSLEDLLDLQFVLPGSVLGAHTHNAGDFMVGITTSLMSMEGSMDGTDEISHAEILGMYDTVHTGMDVRTTMVSLMHAPTDDTTLMVMIPKIRKETRHRDMDGAFTSVAEGIGDVQFHALHVFHREGAHRFHFDAGVSAPTGSIDEGSGGMRDHYMQQLGSGTVDLMPGITYLGETEDWAWGTQLNMVVRLGENKHDYALGNRYGLTSWIMRRLQENLAVSLRLNAQHWGNVKGADPALDKTAISENDPQHQGGDRVDALVGLTFYGTDGALEDHRIEFEMGWPVYQNLDGPQMQTDFIGMLSWKVVF
ncbi:MAG: transporter [Planctomycetota bacterium]|jgi:hypothetical protein